MLQQILFPVYEQYFDHFTFDVPVTGPSEFAIEFNAEALSSYSGGGIGTQVRQPQTKSYVSLCITFDQPKSLDFF